MSRAGEHVASLGLFAYGIGSDMSLRTLYPIVNGVPDASQPGTVAAVGIGIIVAGVGAAVLLFAACFAPKTDRAGGRRSIDQELPRLRRIDSRERPRVQALRLPI